MQKTTALYTLYNSLVVSHFLNDSKTTIKQTIKNS